MFSCYLYDINLTNGLIPFPQCISVFFVITLIKWIGLVAIVPKHLSRKALTNGG